MKEELKSCPFCGSNASVEKGDIEGYYVSCFTCFVVVGEIFTLNEKTSEYANSGYFTTRDNAVLAWNMRS